MALAQMGHLTLCLDCDVGLRNLDIAMAMTDSAVMDFTDVMAGRCTLEEAAARHPRQKNLYLLTAPARSGAAEIDREAFRALFSPDSATVWWTRPPAWGPGSGWPWPGRTGPW